ncbi:LacI family transcriptional regulator [Komagataeibacter medellinensis]|uniref:LacI family transcriptional regulator n=1 Tax=Komagataeibacter medellinensis TaxID=1177712 RepID=A0ABQ6VX46_9PROT|nr:LacI family DNA-binding transcriptional regulator [Komagataeibacter medellinensis]KAB8123008.1 LacI family transcriptional regulator [Komagataeibacter medellinensis]
MAKRVTLADLAEQTGLNISTISRALSRPDRVSSETRRLVEKVASQLGYATNIAARNLSRGTSDTILVLASSFKGQAISPVFTQLLLGVCEEAKSQGLNVMLQQCLEQTISARDIIRYLQTGVADSALLVAAEQWLPPTDSETGEKILPIVSIFKDLTAAGLTSVMTQETDGYTAIVDHLLARGHRQFAFVSGPEDIMHEQIRYRAVKQRLSAQGLDNALIRLKGGPFDMPSGQKAGQAFVALENRPSAVICCSDALALGFMHAVMESGLRVPQDVAIAGFDGMDYTAFTTPSLTTVIQPAVELGRVAVQLLGDLHNGKITVPRLVALAPTFMARQSTCPPCQD